MKRLEKRFGCPVEFAVTVVGGKWKTVLLARLKQGPLRYGELRALTPGIADKVLTERLADLERLGLIDRRVRQGLDGRRYGLTERGERLRPVLEALHAWGEAEAEAWDVRLG